MDNIIHLPDPMHRAWRVSEAALLEWMESEGCSPEEAAYVCGQLKPVYQEFGQLKRFSGDSDKVLIEVNAWMRTQIIGLLQTVALREIELFRLRDKRHG